MHQLVIMHLVDFIFFKGKTLLKMTLKTACTLCIAFLSFNLLAAPLVVVKQAEDAKINPQRSEIVVQKSFKSGKGVAHHHCQHRHADGIHSHGDKAVIDRQIVLGQP